MHAAGLPGDATCKPVPGPASQGLALGDPFPRQASTRHRAPRALGDPGTLVFLSAPHELRAHPTCSVHRVCSCLGGPIAARKGTAGTLQTQLEGH